MLYIHIIYICSQVIWGNYNNSPEFLTRASWSIILWVICFQFASWKQVSTTNHHLGSLVGLDTYILPKPFKKTSWAEINPAPMSQLFMPSPNKNTARYLYVSWCHCKKFCAQRRSDIQFQYFAFLKSASRSKRENKSWVLITTQMVLSDFWWFPPCCSGSTTWYAKMNTSAFCAEMKSPKRKQKDMLSPILYIFSGFRGYIIFISSPRLGEMRKGGTGVRDQFDILGSEKTPMWKAFFRLPKNTILNRECKLELDFWPIPLESKIKHAVRSSFASKKNNSGSFHRFKASGDHREHYGMQVT